ncbi:MAG: protein kinase [Anaerolineales bacterium]|jgi:serine/threonine protein kinase
MNEPIILNERYQLEERRGSGGMAMVYRARDLMLERTVAIKLLRADFSSDPDFRERFRQEAKAAANLSHPNIVTVHDFGLDEERLFIVMEYVPGTDLKSIIKKRGVIPADEAVELIVQACAGIGYAHRAGLVHCDVKPQNMLVTPDKRLKVVDFGIARALASIVPDEKTDVVWGSPQYFSPEQATGIAPSPASDVYSLGVVMFEMLTGQQPFTADSSEELARLHREVPPPSPRRLNASIPKELEQILLKVLSKEPSARYRTADQLGRVLVTFTQSSTSGPRPHSSPVTTPSFSSPTESPKRAAYLDQAETTPWQNAAPVAPLPKVEPPPLEMPATNQSNPLDIDWATWLLGLLAFIAVGGLIPFCLWVYYTVNPPF